MNAFTDEHKKDMYNHMIIGVLSREYENPENPEMFGFLRELATPVRTGHLDGIIARRLLRKLHKYGYINHLKIPREEYYNAIEHDKAYGEPEE